MDDVRTMGYAGKFWITEVGFATSGIYPWTVTNSEFPLVVAKSLTLLSVSGVARVVWYTLLDKFLPSEVQRQTTVHSAEDNFGLAYPDYAPKNGAFAYHAVSMVADGSAYEPALVENGSRLIYVQVYPFIMVDGRLGIVAWSTLPAHIEFSETISGTMPSINGPGQDAFSGKTLALSGTPIVLVTNGVVDTSTAQHIRIHKSVF